MNACLLYTSSEDTYRTLMAADSAVMVIDAAKGVEAQTKKLFKVCTMRGIPIFTFINKMDREARNPFDLLEEIEQVLGIETYPMNWPIGSGKDFKGVYDRNAKEILAFQNVGKVGTQQAQKLSLIHISFPLVALLTSNRSSIRRFSRWLFLSSVATYSARFSSLREGSFSRST